MADDELLSTLREVIDDDPPSQTEKICMLLAEMNLHLEDIKTRLGVRNEIATEALAEGQVRDIPKFGSQASPARNIPRPVRRW